MSTVLISPDAQKGLPMMATSRAAMNVSQDDLRELPESVLDVLSMCANELFDLAMKHNRFALATDVSKLIARVDREQARRA